MFVIYTGKKTAFFNNQSYFPGEVFEITDVIVRKEKGKPVEKPRVLNPEGHLREATESEIKAFLSNNPRRLAAYEAKKAAKKAGRSRAEDPEQSDAARRKAQQEALDRADPKA